MLIHINENNKNATKPSLTCSESSPLTILNRNLNGICTEDMSSNNNDLNKFEVEENGIRYSAVEGTVHKELSKCSECFFISELR